MIIPYRPSIDTIIVGLSDLSMTERSLITNEALLLQSKMLSYISGELPYMAEVGFIDEQHREYDAYILTILVGGGKIPFYSFLEPLITYVVESMLFNACIPSNTIVGRNGALYQAFRTGRELSLYKRFLNVLSEFTLQGLIDEDQESIIVGSLVSMEPFWKYLSPYTNRVVIDWSDMYEDLIDLYLDADFTRDVRIHLEGFISYERRKEDGQELCGQSK